NLAGRAIAALESIVLDEGALQCMERRTLRQTLDGRHLRAILHHRKGQAGIDAPSIEQHRAGAALAVITALFGAGEVEVFAQSVEQGGPWREIELVCDPVHGERDADLCRGWKFLGPLRCRAFWGHGDAPPCDS